MANVYTDKKVGRNICIKYSDDNSTWYHRYFYAEKKKITTEDEEIRGEKKLASGEIRVRWKKRRKIELDLCFFGQFNQLEDTFNTGYANFETVINSPFLRFEYNPELDSECPYVAPDVFARDNTSNVILKDKKVEYLEGLIDYKTVTITLIEAKNWYA